MGGDEINENCWDFRPEIKEWMKQHSIGDYNQL